jgi:thiamine transporter
MNYIQTVLAEFIKKLTALSKVPTNILDVFTKPTTIIALLGCLLIFVVVLKVRKVNITSQMLARIGMAMALTCVLGMIRFYHFPQGGSITPGRLVPIMLIAFIYGPEIGLFTGFVYGILDLFMDPYIVAPIQVLFDYPLAFMMIGLAGFFKNNKPVGVVVATLGRMICSTISGVVFFAEYAPAGMSPLRYSLSVNVPVVGIEGLICLVIIMALPVNEIIKQTHKNTVRA